MPFLTAPYHEARAELVSFQELHDVLVEAIQMSDILVLHSFKLFQNMDGFDRIAAAPLLIYQGSDVARSEIPHRPQRSGALAITSRASQPTSCTQLLNVNGIRNVCRRSFFKSRGLKEWRREPRGNHPAVARSRSGALSDTRCNFLGGSR
jgi:hypothetical protein